MEYSKGPRAAGAATTSGVDRCQSWYDAYGQMVYRFLRFHVDSADTADDLTSEIFLRILEAQERYDPARGEARFWVFSIARNVLRDHFRRARVRRHVGTEALRDIAADAPSPEERVLRQEAVAGLLAGIARLGAADRELIGLRYGSEFSITEIAGLLGLPEATVRTRLWRALGRLRGELDKVGD